MGQLFLYTNSKGKISFIIINDFKGKEINMPNSVNYVKFQRGTIAAYNALKTRGLINSNTLYFIYESADKKNGFIIL